MSQPKKRSNMPVSVPIETYERMQRFLEQFGATLGYSTSPSRYVAAALVEKMTNDERRLERLSGLGGFHPERD